MANDATLEKSLHLKAIFDLLLDMKYHTTREVERGANVSAAGQRCGELRRQLERTDLPLRFQGFKLPFAKYIRTTERKAKVQAYRLEIVEQGQQSFLESGFSGKTAVLKG